MRAQIGQPCRVTCTGTFQMWSEPTPARSSTAPKRCRSLPAATASPIVVAARRIRAGIRGGSLRNRKADVNTRVERRATGDGGTAREKSRRARQMSTAFLMACLLGHIGANLSQAQVGKLYPVDEAYEDSTFIAFRLH